MTAEERTPGEDAMDGPEEPALDSALGRLRGALEVLARLEVQTAEPATALRLEGE